MAQAQMAARVVAHEFFYRGPDSKQVSLVGTFNEWNPEATPMRPKGHGMWSVTMELTPGRYEYKFVVDGEWRREPACEESDHDCPHCVPNAFGTKNCVLNLPG